MKLEDVKDRIDNFFDNHTSEEIYELALKYGAKKVNPVKDEIFQRFKESLDNMSDEDFEKLLDEMKNDSNGSNGITVGEFLSKIKDTTEKYHNYVGRIVKYWDKNENQNYTFLIMGYDEGDDYFMINNNWLSSKHIFEDNNGDLHIFGYEVII